MYMNEKELKKIISRVIGLPSVCIVGKQVEFRVDLDCVILDIAYSLN